MNFILGYSCQWVRSDKVLTPKELARNSIIDYLNDTAEGKQIKIQHIKEKLDQHYQGIQYIGIGYSQRYVKAGEIFLRFIKLYKL